MGKNYTDFKELQGDSDYLNRILMDTEGMLLQRVEDTHLLSVNPREKDSIGEMELAYRLGILKQSYAIQHEDFRSLVSAVEKEHEFYQEIKELSADEKRFDGMSKIVLGEEESEYFETESKLKREAMQQTKYATLLSCAEYAAGMRDTIPDIIEFQQPVKDFLADHGFNRIRLDEMKEQAQSYDLSKPGLSQISFNYVNPAMLALQYHMSEPTTFGDWPNSDDFGNQEISNAKIINSMNQTAANTLNPLFDKFEQNYSVDLSSTGMNRARLILVGGKTVEELIRADYVKNTSDAECLEYEKYFDQNYKEKTNEIIAAAMAADKRVEVFIPNKEGKVSDPIQMVPSGVEPTPLMPVARNTWHKVMSKFGFYKDEMLRQKEYQSMIQKREEVRQHVQDMPFEMKRKAVEKISDAKQEFRIAESVFYADLPVIAMGTMIARGFAVEDILNPNALDSEKRQVGREVENHIDKEDGVWLADTLGKGIRATIRALDQRINSLSGMEYNPELKTVEKLTSMLDNQRGIVNMNGFISGPYRDARWNDLGTVTDIVKSIDTKKTELKNTVLLGTGTYSLEELEAKTTSSSGVFAKILEGKMVEKIIDGKGGIEKPFSEKSLSGWERRMIQTGLDSNRDTIRSIDNLCITPHTNTMRQFIRKQVKDDTILDHFKIDTVRNGKNEFKSLKIENRGDEVKNVIKVADDERSVASIKEFKKMMKAERIR